MEYREITNSSNDKPSIRQAYETVVGDNFIEIIAYKFVDGNTNVVQPQQGNKTPEDITLDAFLSRSLDEMADGLMTLKPEFTIKNAVEVTTDAVTIRITK